MTIYFLRSRGCGARRRRALGLRPSSPDGALDAAHLLVVQLLGALDLEVLRPGVVAVVPELQSLADCCLICRNNIVDIICYVEEIARFDYLILCV